MTEVLGVMRMRFWAVTGSSCLDIRSCKVSLTILWFEGVRSCQRAVERLLLQVLQIVLDLSVVPPLVRKP